MDVAGFAGDVVKFIDSGVGNGLIDMNGGSKRGPLRRGSG